MSDTSYSIVLSSAPRQQLTVLDLLPDKSYACDECGRHMLTDDTRYHCTRCRDYDTCTACHSTSLHTHDDGETQPLWTEIVALPEPATAPLKEDASFAATVDDALLRFDSRPCVGQRTRVDDPSSVTWLTYRSIRQRVHACSRGLLVRISTARPSNPPSMRFCQCTSEPRPCVAIWAGNCIDWLVADLACHLQHYVVVPIDVNIADADAAVILQQMEVSFIFVDPATLPRVANLAPFIPAVHGVAVLNAADLVMYLSVDGSPQLPLMSIEALEREGVAGLATPIREARPDCVVSVMYTSGSTGQTPKGVLITDRGYSYRAGQSLRAHDVRIACYLPLSNSTGRSQAMRCLCVGGALGLIQSPSDFLTDLAWVQPTTLSCPPRMWNVLHAGYCQDLARLLAEIPACGLTKSEVSDEAESVAFGRFRARLGGRVMSVSVGGAKSSPGLIKFLQRCFGVGNASDSYGATECGSIARGGYLLPGVEVELLDVPELGFSSTDKPWPRGELCVRTGNMAAGYTSTASSDAAFIRLQGRVYYRTGDVVELRRGNRLRGEGDEVRVLDRTSNVVKLSSGLFVSPEAIEHALELHCPHLDRVLLHVPIGSDVMLAVLVPCASAPHWSDMEWMEEIGRVVQSHGLPKYCIPSRIHVDRSGQSWEQLGLLAAQQKKRRTVLLAHYKPELDRLLAADAERKATDTKECLFSTSLHERLQATIVSHLGQPVHDFGVCAGKSWAEAGGNSLTAIAFAHSLRSLVPSRPVTATQILGVASLQTLLDRLLGDGDVAYPAPAARIDWALECSLPRDLVPVRATEEAPSPVVLLTGATGFLGSFLLAELLERRREWAVVCIVRAASQEEGRARLARGLMQYSLASSESDAFVKLSSRHVRVEVGDVALDHFGLPPHCYEDLVGSVTHVIHNASRVNFVWSYSALRRDNVQSTVEVLRFCCAGGRSKPLCYVSTASAESCNLANVDHASHTGYAQTKFVSEQLVQRAGLELGLPASIVRPTSIIGDSNRGAGPLDSSRDLVSALWLGVVQVGRIHLRTRRPRSSTRLPSTLRDLLPLLNLRGSVDEEFQLVGLPAGFCLVPVDHVARVIVAQLTSSLDGRSAAQCRPSVLAVANPRGDTSPLSLVLAAELPLDTPVIIGEEAEQAWRQLVLSDALPSVMRAFRDILLHPAVSWPRSRLTSQRSDFHSIKTPDADPNTTCPDVDIALLRRCFQRLNSGWFQRQQR